MRHLLMPLALLLAAFLASQRAAAAEPAPSSPLTFNKHIAPLVFQHCSACHHPGEVAPFSLLTYDDVKKRAKQIQDVTKQRFMPPWKGVEGHGQFIDERRLKPDEIESVARWVEQGAPEGDAKDLPPTPKFATDWKLGQPDIVITMAQPYEIPADGPDIYRNFAFSLTLPEGKYIKAAEFKPGNRRIVHHAVITTDPSGKGKKDDEADPAPGYKGSLNFPGPLFPGSISTWTPGRDPLPLPKGLSFPWKPGAGFVLQLHLHPSGKPESDQTSIGFYLTDEPPQRTTVDLLLSNNQIDIPPDEKQYKRRDELTLPVDVELFGLFPHMHLIGRDFKVTAKLPGAEDRSLLWINDWDFNWQNYYEYQEPVRLPAGTKLVMETVHDNSVDNVRNPSHPPARVIFGEGTTNEMSVALLQLVLVQDSDFKKFRETLGKRIAGGIMAAPQKNGAGE